MELLTSFVFNYVINYDLTIRYRNETFSKTIICLTFCFYIGSRRTADQNTCPHSGGSRGGPPPPPHPFFWVKKEEMTEGKMADRAIKSRPALYLPPPPQYLV